jgi:hypothetical protein
VYTFSVHPSVEFTCVMRSLFGNVAPPGKDPPLSLSLSLSLSLFPHRFLYFLATASSTPSIHHRCHRDKKGSPDQPTMSALHSNPLVPSIFWDVRGEM